MIQVFNVLVKIETNVWSAGDPYLTDEIVKLQIEKFLDGKTMAEGLPCHCESKTKIEVMVMSDEDLGHHW